MHKYVLQCTEQWCTKMHWKHRVIMCYNEVNIYAWQHSQQSTMNSGRESNSSAVHGFAQKTYWTTLHNNVQLCSEQHAMQQQCAKLHCILHKSINCISNKFAKLHKSAMFNCAIQMLHMKQLCSIRSIAQCSAKNTYFTHHTKNTIHQSTKVTKYWVTNP